MVGKFWTVNACMFYYSLRVMVAVGYFSTVCYSIHSLLHCVFLCKLGLAIITLANCKNQLQLVQTEFEFQTCTEPCPIFCLLHIKPEMHNISVFNGIVFTLHSQFTGIAAGCF